MSDILVVVDMQNDFVRGPLGSEEACAVIDKIKNKCQDYINERKTIIFTLDCHDKYYDKSIEGQCVPKHCMIDTEGWEVVDELKLFLEHCDVYVTTKSTYGSTSLIKMLDREYYGYEKNSVEFVGVCTDICVISNALMTRSMVPHIEVVVDASCCAGTSPHNHATAINVMRACNVEIIGE